VQPVAGATTAPKIWDLHGNPIANPELAKPGVPAGPDRVFVTSQPGGSPTVHVVRGGREQSFSSTNRTLADQEKRGYITSQPDGNTLSVGELRGKRVLDLAAGTEGRTVRDLRKLGVNAQGMDIALEEAAKQTGYLHRGDLATGVPVKGQFDVAYEFYGGLAYGLGKETGPAFQNAIARLRPGGTLYLAPLSESARKTLQPFVEELVKRGGKLKKSNIYPPGDEIWRIVTPTAGS
jgi:SAM-dependent methyltransferase